MKILVLGATGGISALRVGDRRGHRAFVFDPGTSG
jgi:hypothetical protein